MKPRACRPAAPAEDLSRSVERIKARWHLGAAPDAAAEFRRRPELLRDRYLAIDLIYEEYCLREKAGRAEPLVDFCGRFPPEIRRGLRNVLRAHCLLADGSDQLLPDRDDDWPAPGASIGRLELRAELARGPCARVYLASDPAAARQVVVKLSTYQTAEAVALGSLAHPHIIPVLWAEWVGRWHVVCTPWVGRVTLRQLIDRLHDPAGRLPRTAEALVRTDPQATLQAGPPVIPANGVPAYPDGVAAVGARLADALAHLHDRGIVHCDVKPSNILIAPGAHAYLIDFDKAALADAPRPVAGTLPYLAPEQLRVLAGRGVGGIAATPADVYSFGVTLFEALTGRLPFRPIGWAATIRDVAAELFRDQNKNCPAARDLNPDVPAWLEGVVARCLSAVPADRPSAGELTALLRTPARGFLGRVLTTVLSPVKKTWGFLAALSRRDHAPSPATRDRFHAPRKDGTGPPSGNRLAHRFSRMGVGRLTTPSPLSS